MGEEQGEASLVYGHGVDGYELVHVRDAALRHVISKAKADLRSLRSSIRFQSFSLMVTHFCVCVHTLMHPELPSVQ